jgi:hypothetical protein
MNITRRDFLKFAAAIPPVAGLNLNLTSFVKKTKNELFLQTWSKPPREFSQVPFWFWNDELSEKEISRQLQDFVDHGIYAFTIHPRVGLPKSIDWLNDKMLYFMDYALKEAEKKNMWCILYDEGMYPSGSASGQVAAENPLFRPRGLFAIDLDEVKPGEEKFGFKIDESGKPVIGENQNLIEVVKRKANGHNIAIVDRYVKPNYSVIRGLHFIDNNPPRRSDKKEVAEETPLAADILNPDAVKSFIKHSYQKYYDGLGKYFGKTVKAMFTDEPSFLGRKLEKGIVAGNKELLKFANNWLKEDFTDKLPSLWYDDEPEAKANRSAYNRALNARLEETYYKQLSDWCAEHKVALVGHPAQPDDIGHLRYFQIPGQDVVWRNVEPNNQNAIEGAESTQAKCASSAMIHLKRRRNSNEYCGAFGHNFTFREMKWLVNWLLIRGCNLLVPHAFYYSVRGPRIDERPPDVGPNNTWWGEFKPFADETSRLCWLNTDSKHVCDIAILGLNDYLPWQAAKICFQNQYDFNYVEARHLWENAVVDSQGIKLAGMHYKVLIIEFDPPKEALNAIAKLEKAGRVIRFMENDKDFVLINSLKGLTEKDVTVEPNLKDLRIRHVIKNNYHFCMYFNEGEAKLEFKSILKTKGKMFLLDNNSGKMTNLDESFSLLLNPHELKIVMIDG